MAGIHLDAVAERDQPLQAVEEPFGAVRRLDGEIRPGGVADEERVAGQDEPRLVAARAVDDRERAVLRPVAGGVEGAHDDVAELDLRPVGERLVWERRFRGGVDAHRHAVLEREPAVAGDMVGVRVCLEHGDDPDAVVGGRVEVLLDAVRGVDDDRDTGALVADEVRGAAEVAVHELPEEHRATVAPAAATI